MMQQMQRSRLHSRRILVALTLLLQRLHRPCGAGF